MPKQEEVVLLGLVEASRRLRVCVATLKALADAGQIPCARDSARRRLFFAADVAAFAKQRKAEKAKRTG